MMTKEERKAMEERVFEKLVFDTTAKNDAIPEKYAMVNETLRAMPSKCGDKRELAEVISALVEAVAGDKVEFKIGASGDGTYEKGEIIVPIENPNSHDYTVGAPCIIVKDGSRAIRNVGTVGNNLPRRDSVRSATEEEARALLVILPIAALIDVAEALDAK